MVLDHRFNLKSERGFSISRKWAIYGDSEWVWAFRMVVEYSDLEWVNGLERRHSLRMDIFALVFD